MTGKAEGLGREKARGGWTPSGREVGFPRLSQWPRQAQGFYSSSTMSMGFGHQFFFYLLPRERIPRDVNMPAAQRPRA